MRNFGVLWQKEWREHVRNYRLIWIPLVFVVLGMMDPLTYYFMDDILKSVGNLPEGMQLTMPNVEALDMIAATTGQLQSIGLIVLIALYCSAISGERKHGTATLLYVRPISSAAIFFSKWAMAIFIGCMAVLVGLVASSYYTEILYGGLSFTDLALFYVIFCVWVIFVLSVTLALSAMTSTAIAAATSIIVFLVGSMADSIVGTYWTYSPFKVASYGLQYLQTGIWPDGFVVTLSICIVGSVVMIALGIYFTQRNRQQTLV